MSESRRTAPRPPRDGTVFISYARADNHQPPHAKTKPWVTFFWDQLRWELTDRGAKNAELWLDRYQIDAAEAFTRKIRAAVKRAKLIVPVFSENWAQSQWCRDEVEGFARAHHDARERIVPIFKRELDRKDLPSLMQGDDAREGYRFFAIDESSGEVHHFYWRGLKERDKYFKTLENIADFIIKKLEVVSPVTTVTSLPPRGRTVFLAESAEELRDARQRLVNDLTRAGHAVVPDIDDLPDTAVGYEAAIRAALCRADMAVILLGDNHGVLPGGGSEPIVDLQLRLARERGLSRVLWAPKWLPDRTDAQRDPFAVASRFGGLKPSEEVFAEEITDLSKWLRDRLDPKAQPSTTSVAPSLVLIAAADTADKAAAVHLARLLQGLGPRILPLGPDDSLPMIENGGFARGVVLWGGAEVAALDACLGRLPTTPPPICLLLSGGDETAKSGFFREGVVAQELQNLPSDRPSARALLEQLEILPLRPR